MHHELLDLVEHVLLGCERHLEVYLVKLAGTAVGARRLVAEAGGDLEVALDPAHHQQLFELLRRLWQGVELAGVEPARDEEVAGSLGAAGGQDRRGDLQEVALRHVGADQLRQAGPGLEAGDDGSPAEIEVAVAEPGVLGDVGGGIDRKREHVGRGQDLDGVHGHLDGARGQLRVVVLLLPRHHLAAHRDHALEAKPGEGLEAWPVGVRDQLHDAAGVAQVDEQQAAVVALCRHPARQAVTPSDVGLGDLTGTDVSVGVVAGVAGCVVACVVGQGREISYSIGHGGDEATGPGSPLDSYRRRQLALASGSDPRRQRMRPPPQRGPHHLQELRWVTGWYGPCAAGAACPRP